MLCTWHVQSLTPDAENCMGTPCEIEHYRAGTMLELAEHLCLLCAGRTHDVTEEEMFRFINRKNGRQIERARLVAAAIQQGPVDAEMGLFFYTGPVENGEDRLGGTDNVLLADKIEKVPAVDASSSA